MSRSTIPHLDWYVATTGSDTTGDGSSGNPWATGTHAYATIRDQFDLQGQFVTIHFASGTYAQIEAEGPLVGGRGAQSCTFLGDAVMATTTLNTPPTTGCVSSLRSRWGAAVRIKNFYLTGANGLGADEGNIEYYSCAFGQTSAAHINVSSGIVTKMDSGSWCAGSGTTYVTAEDHGEYNGADAYETFGFAGIAFSIAGYQADELSIINLQNTSWGGYGFTGPRFNLTSGAMIESAGQATTWIPGSAAGVTDGKGFWN